MTRYKTIRIPEGGSQIRDGGRQRALLAAAGKKAVVMPLNGLSPASLLNTLRTSKSIIGQWRVRYKQIRKNALAVWLVKR